MGGRGGGGEGGWPAGAETCKHTHCRLGVMGDFLGIGNPRRAFL